MLKKLFVPGPSSACHSWEAPQPICNLIQGERSLSLMGLTAGSLSYVGGSFFVLRSDLRAERELRRQDAAHYKTLLAAERSERKSG